jgi:hypothetical protein
MRSSSADCAESDDCVSYTYDFSLSPAKVGNESQENQESQWTRFGAAPLRQSVSRPGSRARSLPQLLLSRPSASQAVAQAHESARKQAFREIRTASLGTAVLPATRKCPESRCRDADMMLTLTKEAI